MDDQTSSEDNIEQVVIQEADPNTVSADTTAIVGAILTIPATLIVLSFFSVIFKIFVNRRLRS